MRPLRRSIATLTLAATAAGAATLVPAAAHAAPTLLGQWSLDGSYEDGASDATADSSGNGLALKAPIGATHLGGAARFGTGATLPTNVTPLQVTSPLLAPAQVTLLAWIKQSGNPGTLRYIAGRGDDGAPTCNGSTFAIYTGYPPNGGDPAGKPGLRFYVRSGAAGVGSLTSAPADAAVFNNQWHLVAGTYDGTSARLYVDGVQVGAPVPGNGALKYALGGGSSFYADGYPVEGCTLSLNSDDWPGALDEVRVYDRALSAAELGRLAASTGPVAPLLISDESLIVPPVPTTPEPPVQPPAPAPTPGIAPPKPVATQQLAAAAAGVEGASKKQAKESLQQALAAAQPGALEAMKTAASASQVGAAQTLAGLSAKERQAIKPDPRMQSRLEAMKYGFTVQVPTSAPGQIVEAAATIALEKKQGGKVKSQQIVLPPVVGMAGPDGKSATLQFPVDAKATAAMTKNDVAKAAVAVQAAALDSLSEMGELEQMRLQQYMNAYSQTMQMLSNTVKKLSDTQATITQNLKGGVTPSERKEQQGLKDKAAKLDKEARKIEQQRDEAAAKAAQTMQSAVQAMLAGIIAAASQTSGAATGASATLIPMATTALSGCKLCQLAATSSS